MKCKRSKNESNNFVTYIFGNFVISSDCHKYELTSVLAAFYSCHSNHCVKSCFQDMFNQL